MFSPTDLLTIDELAQQTGVTPRNIRFYTAEGLLPPPAERGRYAATHVLRLRLIRRLTAEFVRLDRIKAQLEQLTDAEIEALLRETETHSESATRREADSPAAARTQASSPQKESAAEYVARVLTSQVPPAPSPASPHVFRGRRQHVPPAAPDFSDASALPPDDADESETWKRIALAPGLELHAHEPLTPKAQQMLAQIVAYAHRLRKA